MKSDVKASMYYKSGKVFPVSNTTNYEIWCVDGDTGIHNVRLDKIKRLYSCNCKNIRLTPCSHIKAVLLQKGETVGKEI